MNWYLKIMQALTEERQEANIGIFSYLTLFSA